MKKKGKRLERDQIVTKKKKKKKKKKKAPAPKLNIF
jgi:hypothetical protein